MATVDKRITQGYRADGTPFKTVSYRARVRRNGHPQVTATFDRKTDADRWAQETEVAVQQGRYLKSVEGRCHTVKDLIDRYLLEVVPQKAPNTQYSQRICLDWWKSQIGSYFLSDVTPAIISTAKSKLAVGNDGKARAPATVLRYLAPMSHAFSIAVREWYWCESNPVQNVQKPRINNDRVRFLTNEELEALLDACKKSENPILYLVVLMAITTGARKNELLTLTWRDVDLERNQIVLRKTKNRETRSVPFTPIVREALIGHSRVRRIDSDLVFPSPNNPKRPYDIRSAWETAVKTAKVVDFRFHDNRHTCASYIAMSGGTSNEIAAVLGQKTLQMVKRYSHIGEQHTAGVLGRMAKKFL